MNQVQNTTEVSFNRAWYFRGILFIIICIALLLDFAFLSGFTGHDDAGYMSSAQRVLNYKSATQPFSPGLGGKRLGVVLPSALFLKATGDNAIAVGLCFTIYHLALILLVYLLGNFIHTQRVGILASGMVAVCPLVVIYAGLALPDIPTTVFLVGALLLLLHAKQTENWRSTGLFLLSGISFGLAYMTKESVLVASPVFFFAMCFPFSKRVIKWRMVEMVAFGMGLLLIAVLELYLLHLFYGDWIVRLLIAGESFDSWANKPASYFKPISRFIDFFRILWGSSGLFLALFLVGSLSYPFLKKRSWVLWGLLMWLVVYNIWGTVSVSAYIPQRIVARYFMFAPPLAAVCLAAVLDTTIRWIWCRRWVARSYRLKVALGMLLFVISLGVFYNALTVSNDNAGNQYDNSQLSSEMAKAIDVALTGFDLPVVVSADYLFRIIMHSDRDPRIQANIRPLFRGMSTPQAFSDLLGKDDFLYVSYHPRRSMHLTANEFEDWAAQRIDSLGAGKINLPVEYIWGQLDASELVDVERLGFFPSRTQRGRLAMFLRLLGWRAAEVRPEEISWKPWILLERIRSKEPVTSGDYHMKNLFSLADISSAEDVSNWVSAPNGVRIEQQVTTIRVTLDSKLSNFYLTFPPTRNFDILPMPVNENVTFPMVKDEGRQIRCRMRYRLNQPVAIIALKLIQYDKKMRILPTGEKTKLERKTIEATQGEHEAIFHTLIEPDTIAIRFLIQLDMKQGDTLDIDQLIIEQLSP